MAYPPMLVKSNMSMNAAKLLAESRDSDLWNSSIHCSYYSLLQMMIHLLIDVKQPPLKIEDLTKYPDSHVYIRDTLGMEIGNGGERESFFDGFDWLKRMRVKADYKVEQIPQDKCLEVRTKADTLRKRAESYFTNGKRKN